MNKLIERSLLVAVLLTGIVNAFTGSNYDGTYLDTEADNSGPTNGVSPWYYIDGQGTAVNTLWRFRSGFGNNGILEADGSGNDSAYYGDKPELYLVIRGLTPGVVYDVDVIFWSSESGSWRIRAGFESGNLTEYLKTDPAVAVTGAVESDRSEYAAGLGMAVADESGEITIYVDDNDPEVSADDQGRRTWYDGVVYKEVGEGCTEPIYFDIAGPDGVGVKDCIVDIYDLVALADQWLSSN